MKTAINGIVQNVIIMLFTGALMQTLALAGSDPGTGLRGTAHDFTTDAIPKAGGASVGMCTFCHTPHKGITTQLSWNHTLSANNFSWEVAKTTIGTNYPRFAGATYKGATAKCLSCHDGSVAVGDIASFKGGSGALSGFKMGDVDGAGNSTTPLVVGANGNMTGNHPVAMPYPYNQVASTYNGTTTGPQLVPSNWQSDPTVSSVANIRLFNDDGTGNISPGPVTGKTGIECASCHDPHNKAAVDRSFLRAKLTGSTQADGYICMQCHS